MLADGRVHMVDARNELISLLSFVDVGGLVSTCPVSEMRCYARCVDLEIRVSIFATLYVFVTWRCICHLEPLEVS